MVDTHITKIINYINEWCNRQTNSYTEQEMDEILNASFSINNYLYQIPTINSLLAQSSNALQYVINLIPLWKQSISNRETDYADELFYKIYDYLQYADAQTIYQNAVSKFMSYPEDYRNEFSSLPNRYTFLKGTIDYKKQDFSLIRIYTDMVKQQLDHMAWFFNRLCDNRSKIILTRIINYWFEYNYNDLGDLHENVFTDYYDLDLYTCDENEVVVDCGAYIGDSTLEYIKTYGKYKSIYAYEMIEESYKQLQENLSSFENIHMRQCGVGKNSCTMYIDEQLDSGMGAKLSDSGKTEVKVVSLDEDIRDKITLIKMDIEGAEYDALLGAKKHIITEKPKLLICTYHNPEDMFTIPRLIDSMRNDYQFYLRYNGYGIWPCDYVLFAL